MLQYKLMWLIICGGTVYIVPQNSYDLLTDVTKLNVTEIEK